MSICLLSVNLSISDNLYVGVILFMPVNLSMSAYLPVSSSSHLFVYTPVTPSVCLAGYLGVFESVYESFCIFNHFDYLHALLLVF